MRLLFVIDSLVTGGAQRQMVYLATGLAQRQHVVEFFVYRPAVQDFAPVLRQAGIQIHECSRSHRLSAAVVLALRTLIERGSFNAVVSFLTTPNLYNLVAKISLRHYPILVVSERTCDPPGRIPPSRRLARPLYRLADHVVVNSYHHREYLAHKHPFLRAKLTTIYNGVDLTHFSPSTASVVGRGRGLGLLAIANMSRAKNGLCLVEALGMLLRARGVCPSVSWAGEQGEAGDPRRYREEMEQAIRRNGLEARWHWLGQRANVAELLREHDALVHPSYIEGLPNVVCEALACGRPVIVSNTLDHPLLVEHGLSGFVFDWRDPADLAAKIREFEDLPEASRADMGRRAREYAERNLALKRYVDDFEGLLRGLPQA